METVTIALLDAASSDPRAGPADPADATILDAGSHDDARRRSPFLFSALTAASTV